MSLLSKQSTRKQSVFKKSKSRSTEFEYSVADLPSLRRKRTIAYNRLAKALEIGSLAPSDITKRDLFFSYHQEIKKIVANFEDAHYSILEISGDSEGGDSGDIQERFDEMYFNVLSINRQLSNSDSSSGQCTTKSSPNIRLPKIVLPTFSGNVKQWPEYIDTFNALIHNSGCLSNTEKFHYLISSLSGDALSVVKAFPVTQEHYNDAYQALTARYKCKRELAFTCWRDILNIEFKYNNPHEFRKSLDLFEENLCILKTIELPIDKWDFVLVYHILSKLDTGVRRDFEEKYSHIELPTYEQLKTFLKSKCEALVRDTHFSELIKSNKSINKLPVTTQPKRIHPTNSLVAASDAPHSKTNVQFVKCPFCSEPHSISSCTNFLNKSLDERMKIATDKKWCYNCLKPSHQLRDCKSVFSCRTCKRNHHSLLHRETTAVASKKSESSLVSKAHSNTSVLLATAIVHVTDSTGKMHPLRALFDTGSQSNFITETAVKRLNLKYSKSTASVSGLGEAPAPIIGDVTCPVGTNDRVAFTLNMRVIAKICGDQPIAKLNTSNWSHIQSLPLADPGFDIPGPVDILLAADVFAESLLSERTRGCNNQPTAFNSIFGWLLLGKTQLASTNLLHSTSHIADDGLNSLVHRFWELDSIPKTSLLTPDETLCELKFNQEHYRDDTGRYVVSLPFKEESEPIFTGTREVALRRFHAIERRLSRDPDLHRQYSDFMSDYEESGHMSLVPVDDVGNGKYYIPHHCVLRPDSSTTRLRVVFDASAKDSDSHSLNDSQLIGPKLQSDILRILLRFRKHDIVFMADVRQMYRQILLTPSHRDYQRILWRSSPREPLMEYQLNTVTYGVSSSPYLACRTLRQLAIDEGESYPLARDVTMSDIYVDDVVSGFGTLSQAKQAKSQLIDLFNVGHFKLRKWVSNVPDLLSDLPREDCLHESIPLDTAEEATHKILGLEWDARSDEFLFRVTPTTRPCSKRTILSELARIFDPLGFLAPITIQAKCLMQKLWILGIGWDDTPPAEIVTAWNKHKTQLSLLSQIRIARQLASTSAHSYQLHGFCDSSELAYGAVIYLRVTYNDGSTRVHLVISKARVAPLKRTSLPRLELCAAVLLADLYKFVRETYLTSIPIQSVHLWSDSTIVLAWLRSHASRWNTFVANRTSHIQETTPLDCWHHVRSEDNPADVSSRGQYPSELVHNTLWWTGPRWLAGPCETWPLPMNQTLPGDEVLIETESRKSLALVTTPTNDDSTRNPLAILIANHSSLRKLVAIVAYVYRFIGNCRNLSQTNRNTFLTSIERHKSLLNLVKYVQVLAFSDEIEKLKTNKILPKPFRKLNPFIDDQGILRVGGRIARSGLKYEHKHPAFLPADHRLTYLIIENVHRIHCHTGVNTTHFLLLQQFWIVSAKRAIRRCLSKCLKCYRTNPKPLAPFMSDLPSYRLQEVKPFSIVGVDFGGPFRIKLGLHRGAKIDKAYLCLFVCLATKAVHLEVVSALSAEGFIAALRRFVSRRGRCSEIHADCGTNFVGAWNHLSNLMKQASHYERIQFKFNPPSAPHFGGVWEIQIKAAKSHFYRVIGDQVLTFEELTTIFAQIESVLNSRPLCPISSDPNDLSVLTPGHFLTLEPLTSVPDEDLTNVKLSRLNRWQLLQNFHQNFWCRWKKEYLNSLTQRAKWTKDSKPLTIGSMVIMRDDNRTPLHWPLGRVVQLFPGADGVARSAMVRTVKNQLLHRPLVKLCPLPVEN